MAQPMYRQMGKASPLDQLGESFGGFEEDTKGSLEIGKFGDLVILNHDPFREPAHEIGRIEVAATIVGGQLMYDTHDVSIG